MALYHKGVPADFVSRVAACPAVRAVLSPTPASMRRLALAGVIADTVIMSTGAAVRLSASGLGCPAWPQCSTADVVASKNAGQTLLNTWIEFGNRLLNFPLVILAGLIFIAAWRFRPDGQRRRDLVWLGAAPLAGNAAAARYKLPLEGVTQLHADIGWLLAGLSVALLLGLRLSGAPPRAVRAGWIMLAALGSQGVIGYTQYFTHLPAGLVWVHVTGSGLVWIAVLRLFFTLRDPGPVNTAQTGTAVTVPTRQREPLDL